MAPLKTRQGQILKYRVGRAYKFKPRPEIRTLSSLSYIRASRHLSQTVSVYVSVQPWVAVTVSGTKRVER